MTVKFENTEEDAIQAILYMNRIQPYYELNQQSIKATGWLTILLGLFLAWTLTVKFSAWMLVSSLTCLYLGFILALCQEKLFRQKISKAIKSGSVATLLGTQEYTPNPKGLHHLGPFSEGILFWSGIKKVAETEQYLALHFSTSQAFLIPKRAFASPQHGAEFLRLVESYRQASTGSPIPETTKGAWWTQSGVTEAENVQKAGRS